MVVTDLPFDVSVKMDDRYSLLLKPGQKLEQTPEEDTAKEPDPGTSQEYAKFLREHDRKCGPEGFVDSARYRHPYFVKKPDFQESTTDLRGNGAQRGKVTVVDLAAKKDSDQRDYEKRLKTIEDHMWQHKQEERELKRVEGDIIKNQRTVRRSLRDYENAITRKRLAEEKKLNQGLEKYTRLTRAQTHKKEELTKARTENNVATEQMHKDQGRKVQLTTTQLTRNYRAKMSEMELRRIEAGRLQEEYQGKLRRKEEEQYKLKQELAELAIQLNMEAQKGRQLENGFRRDRKREQHVRLSEDRKAEGSLENKLARSDGDNKASEATKRKLSADLMLTRAHLQLKDREESRHKQDTVSRLKNNMAEQKQLNEVAMQAEMDLKSKQIDQRLQEHNTRRKGLAASTLQLRKERSETQEAHLSQKAAKRQADQRCREHQDHLKHFLKEVNRGEELEYSLYHRVKNAEYARQKQEQTVRRLSNKLLDTKRTNAIKIKEEMTELNKEEETLTQKLQREQALLAKMHTQREENYLELQKHREKLRMDKYLLNEHQREHERLMRIGGRIEPASAPV